MQAITDPSSRWTQQLAVLNRAGLEGSQLEAARGVLQRNLLWHKSTLQVCIGPSSYVDQHLDFAHQVRDAANEWLANAKMKFDWGGDSLRRCDAAEGKGSDVRTYLNEGPNQAYFGVIGSNGATADVEGFPGYSVVLAFPDRNAFSFLFTTPPQPGNENWKFYVLHEFGHALGFLHEQQRIDCRFDVQWLENRRSPPFTEAFVKTQMAVVGDPLAAFPADAIQKTAQYVASGYDVHSAMQYNETNKDAFLDGTQSPCYRPAPVAELSDRDKAVAAAAYDGSTRAISQTADGKPIIQLVAPDASGKNVKLSDKTRAALRSALSLTSGRVE